MGYFRPDFPKIFLASDWWRASSEIFGNLRKSSEKSSESVGKAWAGQGGKKSREGWVGEGQKKEGRGGWVMTSSKK